MKSLLIRIGKALDVLKRDGILAGGKRILGYLAVFLKNIFGVASGDILIITSGVGDSALYRAHNQAEELRFHGFCVSVTMSDNPFLAGMAKKFKVFIFHRTMYAAVSTLIVKVKENGGEIIFDTDDLVFDAKYVHMTDHYRNMSELEKKQYEKGVGEEIVKDPYVKTCVASTRFLASKLEEYPARNATPARNASQIEAGGHSVAGGGKKVFVSTNKLSENWMEMAEKILKDKKQNKEKVRLGYFSGTIGHNKDFSTISDALVEILEKYPQAEIFLAGPLELEEKFEKYAGRIIRSGYVPREKHFENISRCDIILAPLERDDFSEGKSELKFSEAGIVAVPTVAVRNQTFSDAITDGENGFLAEGKEEWVLKLEKLIIDEKLRKEMGEKAREKTLADYTTKNSHNEEYYNYLKSKL